MNQIKLTIRSLLVLTTLITAFAARLPSDPQRPQLKYKFIHVVYDNPRDQPGRTVEINNPWLLPDTPQSRVPFQTAPGMFAYTELDTLIVIYPNTAAGTLNTSDITHIKQHIVDTVKFNWRHSYMRLYINLNFIVVDDFKDASEFSQVGNGGYWLFPGDADNDGNSVESDLLIRGVTSDQYDSINFLWAHNNGSIPAAYGGLGGTWIWELGFTGITMNPVFQATGEQNYSTAFPHELQHSLDFMLDASGYSEYFHADQPWNLPGVFGEGWSFWVHGMEVWPEQNWLVFRSPWGDILELPDSDQDGVPDQGAGLPVTEQSLGSSTTLSDTDADGLADLRELMSGIFLNADLNYYDTDGDKALDGNDTEPIYTTSVHVKERSNILDGNPAGWNEIYSGALITNTPFTPILYANWDSNYLYIMVRVDRFSGINLKIDATGDGWFHGKDNYEIGIDPSYSNPIDDWIIGYARVFDCSPEIISQYGYPLYDDAPNYPSQRLVHSADILRYARSDGDGYLVQIAIPANPTTGLSPQHGDRIGVSAYFDYINRQGGLSGWAFEEYDLVYLTLWDDDSFPPGFCDSFNTEMVDLRWTWVDPLADSTHSQLERPGYLRLSTPDSGHDLFINQNAPRLLQTVGQKFDIHTRVSLSPATEEYQGAGLLIWQDADNYIRLELKTLGNLRFIYRESGTYNDGGDIQLSTTTVYLRLVRDIDQISAWYSLDGVIWIQVGGVTQDLNDTVSVGIHIINEWQDAPLQADFDELQFGWCEVELLSERVYLPVVMR